VRIALHAAGDVGKRAGRILQAERGLTALGLFRTEGGVEDRRTTATDDLTGYTVLATDADPDRAVALAREAVAARLHAVVAADVAVPEGLAAAASASGRTVLTGASLGAGLAAALAAAETRSLSDVSLLLGWTEPGDPLRRGEAVPFPDPVGARWARLESCSGGVTRAVAPIAGIWGGVAARVSGTLAGTPVERVVGVADEADHLQAIALAAGTIAVAEGSFPAGPCTPDTAADAYLQAALRVGMDVATYSEG
jgi:hypothetical protein